VEKNVSDITL